MNISRSITFSPLHFIIYYGNIPHTYLHKQNLEYTLILNSLNGKLYLNLKVQCHEMLYFQMAF